jgi:hypothetical protein
MERVDACDRTERPYVPESTRRLWGAQVLAAKSRWCGGPGSATTYSSTVTSMVPPSTLITSALDTFSPSSPPLENLG